VGDGQIINRVAFLAASGRLHRSDDFARTWTAVDLAPIGASMADDGVVAGEQMAQQVQVSPNFARDRTAYLTLGMATYDPFPLTASFISLRYSDSPVVPTIHYQTNVGVAVTRDGGLTWHPAASGLEVDGVPHRFVRNLAISPTFGADRTLFAWAWDRVAGEVGEQRPDDTVLSRRTANAPVLASGGLHSARGRASFTSVLLVGGQMAEVHGSRTHP